MKIEWRDWMRNLRGEDVYIYILKGVCIYDIYKYIWRKPYTRRIKDRVIYSIHYLLLNTLIGDLTKRYWKIGLSYIGIDIIFEIMEDMGLTTIGNKFIEK